jgi:hypothetical protein
MKQNEYRWEEKDARISDELVFNGLRGHEAGRFVLNKGPWYYHIEDATVNLYTNQELEERVIISADIQDKINSAKKKLEQISNHTLIEILSQNS